MLKIEAPRVEGFGRDRGGHGELFQGREKRAIVASCVRSKPYYLIKTQRDWGSSRTSQVERHGDEAKELLVVVNPETVRTLTTGRSSPCAALAATV